MICKVFILCQCIKHSLQYAIRLAANPSNPAHEVTFPPNYVNLYEQKPTAIK